MKWFNVLFKTAEFVETDMNYLVDPNGVERFVPNFSHSGEAQKIVLQTEGREMEPGMALDYLVKKKKWIRVSGEQFELFNFNNRRTVLISFMMRHNDYYKHTRTIEIDDRAKGNSYQVRTDSLISVDLDSEAYDRAQELSRWRQEY